MVKKNNKTRKIKGKTGIDIFSGAGGLSLGAVNAGINVSLAIEKDPIAAKTFARNHCDAKVLSQDISTINPKKYFSRRPFIVFGGPPCQGFSRSNTKTRYSRKRNNFLFNHFIRFVDELQPQWFLFENVVSISGFNKGKTVAQIKKCFHEMGYDTTTAVLLASDYGVPQDRSRFFMVGNRLGIAFEFPSPKSKKVTVKEAIADLPKLVNGAKEYCLPYKKPVSEVSAYAKKMRKHSRYALQNLVSRNEEYVLERYKYIKQGQNWEAIPARLMKNYSNTGNCHSGIYRRLKASAPSVVIANYRKNMLIHPYENRGLSVREAARLQSFPDTFVFEGLLDKVQQQIANAVPPLLAEAIFRKILSYH